MSDESPFPTQAEMNEEDAKDFWSIVHWLADNRPETRLAGEPPADWIIRLLSQTPSQ